MERNGRSCQRWSERQNSSATLVATFIKLHIDDCPNLKPMPLCPNLEELKLVNDTLSVLTMATMSTTGGVVGTISASSPSSYSKLKSLD